jgi:hypothetical protein
VLSGLLALWFRASGLAGQRFMMPFEAVITLIQCAQFKPVKLLDLPLASPTAWS